MFASSWVTRGKVALEGTETERQFANVLFDDSLQVLTSFQLNQIASLTYGDEVCDQIFEILDSVMAHPVNHSPLCLQKSLVIAKHCLIFGSEKCVNSVWALGRHVDHLQEFNTVLIAQERGTPDAWWQRVKGGGVDKGLPVREAAKELFALIQSKEQIQMLRHTSADPNSLVPIGDKRAAFVSDEVRHFMLKKRLEEELGRRTKSNLAKAEGGYGGGYQTKDGKTIVGAAHGVDEMLAAAKREKKKYSDEGPPPGYNPPEGDLFSGEAPAPAAMDLLDFGGPTQSGPVTAPQEVDLLDISAAVESTDNNDSTGGGTGTFGANPLSNDLLGMQPQVSSAPAFDLLGMPPPSSTSEPAMSGASDLLKVMTTAPPLATSGSGGVTSGNNENVAGDPSFGTSSLPTLDAKKPIMGSNSARFAALDNLAGLGGSTTTPGSSAEDAMKRILGEVDVTAPAPAHSTAIMNGSITSIGGSIPPPTSMAPPLIAPDSTLRFGATFGDSCLATEDEDAGFVMGGGIGDGLQPKAPPPPMPPPPPPP